ncbi:hypothetical protein [uncultured Ruegeria sp.]|uniref:hypothetical protein n=1 Tax=uncultured Ruegeria sp. TaxID=259304 RepID=UPI0026120C07|nr:hypothetical protein [uncultured Ruegeria sp.]
MTAGEEIYPPSDGDGCQPFRDIAAFLRCDFNTVVNAYQSLPIPEWSTPEHQKALKNAAGKLNKVVRHAENLIRSLNRLSNNELNSLIQAGTITPQQIEFLIQAMQQDADQIGNWRDELPSLTSRNHAAYIVSEGVRRLYRRLRKEVSYGQNADSGAPSGEFCKTVEFAIGSFGIVASWRGPAMEAWRKQHAIEDRYRLMRMKKHISDAHHASIHKEIDLAGVQIDYEGTGNSKLALVSIRERPDIPAIPLKLSWFSSGVEIQKYASEFAERLSNPD